MTLRMHCEVDVPNKVATLHNSSHRFPVFISICVVCQKVLERYWRLSTAHANAELCTEAVENRLRDYVRKRTLSFCTASTSCMKRRS